MTSENYSYEVGKYRERPIQIGVRAEPSLDSPESWAVFLYFEDTEGERTHIARVDTSHGEIHLDRLYRESMAETKRFDVEISAPHEAEAFLRNKWQSFCQIYADNYEFP